MAVNFWVKPQGIYAVGIHLTMSLVLWAFPYDADQLQMLWPTPISSSHCSWAIGEVCKDLSEMVIKRIAPSHLRDPDFGWPILQSGPLLCISQTFFRFSSL